MQVKCQISLVWKREPNKRRQSQLTTLCPSATTLAIRTMTSGFIHQSSSKFIAFTLQLCNYRICDVISHSKYQSQVKLL